MKRKPLCALLISSLLFCWILALPAQADELTVTAPSVVLMEVSTGQVLFEKESHAVRPCASITKVMTLCLTFEAIQAGKLNLTDTLTASAHAASMGGSDIWLKEGEQMTVDDLIKATVIMSANDAAVVLAENVAGSEEAFVQKMNEKAQALGMADTVFKNCNGLDEEGHVTSAHDVALMSRELLKYPKIQDYTLTWIDYVRGGSTQLVNTNKLIRSYNGITGLKTGTTSQAGSCITATAVKAGKSPKILMKAADSQSVHQEVQMQADIAAPIQKGDVLGQVVYSSSGKTLAQVPITAAEDVEAITFGSAFRYLLGAFFSL